MWVPLFSHHLTKSSIQLMSNKIRWQNTMPSNLLYFQVVTETITDISNKEVCIIPFGSPFLLSDPLPGGSGSPIEQEANSQTPGREGSLVWQDTTSLFKEDAPVAWVPGSVFIFSWGQRVHSLNFHLFQECPMLDTAITILNTSLSDPYSGSPMGTNNLSRPKIKLVPILLIQIHNILGITQGKE